MVTLLQYIKKPKTLLISALKRLWWIPDRIYIQILFYLKMGRKLNLKNPQTFNEKLQWLKLYNRHDEYTIMVDKYEAKKYVASIIGDNYIIPTIGVWNSVDEIDFDILPDKFVLKTTNGGGSCGVVICKDKALLDIDKTKKRLNQSLKVNIYRCLKEWPYKNVKPRIIAEQYLEDSDGELKDYKFTCADGMAHNVMICYDRNVGDTKFYFFDRDWNLLRLNKRGKNAPSNFTLPKPESLDEMFNVAAKLSEGIPYLRVDLYNINGRVFFGEMTFFPQSGFDNNLLKETDILFGQYIKLPNKN